MIKLLEDDIGENIDDLGAMTFLDVTFKQMGIIHGKNN